MNGKARITRIGGFVNTPDGVQPVGWAFDGTGRNVNALEITNDFRYLWGGWSVADLQEAARRPAEFLEVP